jgi:methyl-accepting chemotaxis protein
MKNAINGVHEWLTELVAYITKIANGDMTAHRWPKLPIRTRFMSGWFAEDQHQRPGGRHRHAGQGCRDGRLGTRSDASKHQGDYRKIVEGINQTLDTIVEPLKARPKTPARWPLLPKN